jgi:hypothetical protein
MIRGDLLNCLMRPESGESHNGYLQTEEPGKPVAAQSMKLEISEKEGPKMQPQSKPKVLEVPWRVTGEFMFKAKKLESEVHRKWQRGHT